MHNTKVPQLLNTEGREFAENFKKVFLLLMSDFIKDININETNK